MPKPAVTALFVGAATAGTLIAISEGKNGNLTETGQFCFQQLVNFIGGNAVASLAMLSTVASVFTYAGARALKLLCCSHEAEEARHYGDYHPISGPNNI